MKKVFYFLLQNICFRFVFNYRPLRWAPHSIFLLIINILICNENLFLLIFYEKNCVFFLVQAIFVGLLSSYRDSRWAPNSQMVQNLLLIAWNCWNVIYTLNKSCLPIDRLLRQN